MSESDTTLPAAGLPTTAILRRLGERRQRHT